MACSWEVCPGCLPSRPSAWETPRQDIPCWDDLEGLLCVVLEERLPMGVRVHYDAQYTVDLSSVSDPAPHASCMLAGSGRTPHEQTHILGLRGRQPGGWLGRL